MGALTPIQREAAETKYENLKSVGEEPFNERTSTPLWLFAISSSDQLPLRICSKCCKEEIKIYLIVFSGRVPSIVYVQPILTFFPSDLPRAYLSATEDVRVDVRELTPEFFTWPE